MRSRERATRTRAGRLGSSKWTGSRTPRPKTPSTDPWTRYSAIDFVLVSLKKKVYAKIYFDTSLYLYLYFV